MILALGACGLLWGQFEQRRATLAADGTARIVID